MIPVGSELISGFKHGIINIIMRLCKQLVNVPVNTDFRGPDKFIHVNRRPMSTKSKAVYPVFGFFKTVTASSTFKPFAHLNN